MYLIFIELKILIRLHLVIKFCHQIFGFGCDFFFFFRRCDFVVVDAFAAVVFSDSASDFFYFLFFAQFTPIFVIYNPLGSASA